MLLYHLITLPLASYYHELAMSARGKTHRRGRGQLQALEWLVLRCLGSVSGGRDTPS